MKKRYTIYIKTKDEKAVARIKEFFHIKGVTVNGEAAVIIEDKGTLAMLIETALRGFIEIRNK